jgi:hypothetical protein
MKTSSKLTLPVRKVLVAMALVFAIGLIGCVDPKSDSQQEKKDDGKLAQSSPDAKSDNVMDDTIDGFWCATHGLPEDECWKCNMAYCNECEMKRDWCKEHLRPKSQCFKCDPTLIDKWAKVYEDRTGKKAPKPKNY